MAPPDNADVVAQLRLELPELAIIDRYEMATRLITIALTAIPAPMRSVIVREATIRAEGEDRR